MTGDREQQRKAAALLDEIVARERQERQEAKEPPCIGLDPDTYTCPFCGADLYQDCRHSNGNKGDSK